MALVGAPSRFSVLKMDVSDPLERKQPTQSKANAQNNNNNQGNKNNKQQQAKQSKKKKDSNANKKKQNNPQANGGGAQVEKFDEWKKRDEQMMQELYEKELQEALLRSRIEQEKPEKNGGFSGENGEAKKKGKVTLSLQEFHQKFPDGSPPPPVHKGEPLAKVLAQRKEQEEEEALRRQSQRDASAILAKEKIQQEYLEKSSQPATVTREEYDKMLEMKKKQIEHMARVLNSANKELAILQEQYTDLERVLAKGEMKKKADLIREVEELRQVKDELTEQIQSLYASLEQERSKNNQLTHELQKRR